MTYALYMNGIYKDVLEEILSVQSSEPDLVCYLQPYKSSRILRLVEQPPTPGTPIVLYASITSALSEVYYRAEVIGWENKSKLRAERLSKLNAHISKYQPKETEIYPKNQSGELCTNLIAIRRLKRLRTPLHISHLIKLSDGVPLKKRTRAGGWSYVKPLPSWAGCLDQNVIEDELYSEFRESVRKSMASSKADRLERLKTAPTLPTLIQIASKGYRRNPDVVAEVLTRAAGICEECNNPAPFRRARDNSPYLEVHHIQMLADGGEDTVENAIAVCPNCHKKLHYGIVRESVV